MRLASFVISIALLLSCCRYIHFCLFVTYLRRAISVWPYPQSVSESDCAQGNSDPYTLKSCDPIAKLGLDLTFSSSDNQRQGIHLPLHWLLCRYLPPSFRKVFCYIYSSYSKRYLPSIFYGGRNTEGAISNVTVYANSLTPLDYGMDGI